MEVNLDLTSGIQPLGNHHTPPKQKYVAELMGLWIFTLCCWTIYRFISQFYFEPFGGVKFYLGSALFMPIIWLTPIFVYWKFVRKQITTPVQFFPKNFPKKPFVFIGLLFGITITMAELILYFLRDLAMFNSGLYGSSELELEWFPFTDSWPHYLIMVLTNLLIVAIIEEFVFRGFLQNQFERVLSKWQSLALATTLFGLSHLPIAIIVYQIEGVWLVYNLIQWIGMGLVLGYAYQVFRNIWLCIFSHGLWNVMLGTFTWRYVGVEKSPSENVQFAMGTLSLIFIIITMMLLIYSSRKKLY